ncbi:conserved Plasmodium protein, unknown function [Plasmodium berghei]|uniref:Uncharacterized protein n=2 Tax=Plasmodium berghei TaxID=5821 RepID=A0A509AJY0_PLABA|nr:conserved Plasmodium protein, unknown function [Plasmodium berghei ANKA]CXI41520.1 conserved Plasmodium protein, unknown function [Plasmodium berghei]SCM21931.1 conserved Plasmodium protein, unknown function [Plasmodium berghei]SCN25172.1 conserved Plasmodium protein, unknown function [Plasmodium berghei]SCO60175.1 conserved Plasmodium protein, unknown function [Plasmodium berghei]SCO61765.1 conserved Plasmodium protein, unknown function [Plasmodium berghei]|eukprot:XP_034421480.1 conserved Plasmodium protein, unknown function [Plasmodium berghei ANKA]
MVQNIKVKVKKNKITERKNKSKKPQKNKEKIVVKSLRKKNKLVKINKIEETAKKLCASTSNNLKFLNMKEMQKKKN